MSEKFAEIKQIPPGRFDKPCTFSAAAPFLKKRAEAGKCRRGGLRLGQRQAHTASFISPSHVVKDVKSGERVRKVVSEEI